MDQDPNLPEPDERKLEAGFRTVPAGRGLAWLLTSARLIGGQLWRLLTVAVIVQLIMSLTRVPVLGLIIALALPILTAGMLQCFHHVRRGLPLSPIVLFSPFAQSGIAARLFILGGIVGLIAVLLISWMLSGIEELQDPELLASLEQGNLQTILAMDTTVLQRAFLAVAIGVAVSGTLGYFAVPLIWFAKLPVGASILTGLKALVKNWRPFLVLGLVLAALSIPLFIVLGLVVGLTLVSGGPGFIQYAIFMLAVLLIQLLMFGTQYCAFSEIFELGGGQSRDDGKADTTPDDQFIA